MKFTYPAVFKKVSDNRYEGYFPDLESCYASGDSLMDAVEEAREAAYNWISAELEDPDGQLPPITDKEDIKLGENEEVCNVLVNIRFMEGWDE